MPGYDVLFGWGAVIVAAFLAAYAVVAAVEEIRRVKIARHGKARRGTLV